MLEVSSDAAFQTLFARYPTFNAFIGIHRARYNAAKLSSSVR